MTEITRVPLQPIAKGALPKLWIGLAAVALAGAGIAWATVPHGIEVEVVTPGVGSYPGEGDVVFAKYVGKLADGTVFDEGQSSGVPFPGLFPDGVPLNVGQMIPGMNDALKQVQKGGKYVVEIPADKAYGDAPPPGSNIPKDADLTFELDVVDIMLQADFEQRVSVFREMMQRSMAQQGEDGEAPPQP